MRVGRVLSATAAAAAVGGCAVLVVAMSNAAANPQASAPPTQSASATPSAAITYASPLIPLPVTTPVSTAATSTTARAHPANSPHPSLTPTLTPAHVAGRPVTRPASTTHQPARPKTTAPKPTVHLTRGVALPVHNSTGSATEVITVVAAPRRTTATLQAWTKAPGGGWLKHGASMTAHIGTQGLTNKMSEFVSATPIGSFTLTQAFGRDSNPGTSLPYFKTSPADWWVSQDKSTYNTHQRCTKGTDGDGCGYKDPSEHLYYETPYYNYAVVINYNTSHPVYPRGSAVFLHVYPPGTGPTAGCVSIPQAKLISIMKWLKPADHPRILIGLA